MKFGLYSSIANPPRGEHLDRCIDEAIAEAQLAEASGFDSCFFGEHHQDHDGFLPSPLIVAAAVAARTTRLRVGTSVILLPLHHPVHVAEDVITLDLVSKGRVILGVGIGYQPAAVATISGEGRNPSWSWWCSPKKQESKPQASASWASAMTSSMQRSSCSPRGGLAIDA